MLIIRFSRTGKKNQAQFRVVVAEKSSPIKGKFVEQLGSWNPHQKEAVLKEDRIRYWMEKGAAVSDSVFNLLVREGVVDEKKRIISLTSKKNKGEEGEGEKTETKEEKKVEKVEEKKDDSDSKEKLVEEKKED